MTENNLNFFEKNLIGSKKHFSKFYTTYCTINSDIIKTSWNFSQRLHLLNNLNMLI